MARKNERRPITPEMRAQVAALTCTGNSQEAISAYLGIGERQLARDYGLELRYGKAIANANVVGTLYKKATGNGDWQKADTGAAIFWAKTQLRWREPPREITGANGGPIQTLDLTRLSNDQLQILDQLLLTAAAADQPADTRDNQGSAPGEDDHEREG